MSEDLESLGESLKGSLDLDFEEISIEFFDRIENKSSKLVGNSSPENHLKAKNLMFPFYFKEPTFVQTIEVETEGFGSTDELEFRWLNALKEEFYTKKRISGEKCRVSVNQVIEGFGIRPPKKRWASTKLKKVEVNGLSRGNFIQSVDDVAKFNTAKAAFLAKIDSAIERVREKEDSVEELNLKLEEISEKTSLKNDEKAQIELENQNLRDQQATLKSDMEQSRTQIHESAGKLQNLEDTIDIKRNESTTLNSQIEEFRKELKGLKDDINMFPTEIKGFADQGGKNVILYTFLSMIPIGIILIVTTAIFNGAVDLSVKYTEMPSMDIVTMLGSRIPFVLVTLGVLTASYKLAKIFISEIVRINRQRLNLTKVSVIAKDVSDSSVEGLGFDDDETYELRTKLKMDLLKSHLKGYVAEDYEREISIGLLDEYNRRRKSKKSDKLERSKKGNNDEQANIIEEE